MSGSLKYTCFFSSRPPLTIKRKMWPRNASNPENTAAAFALDEIREGEHTPGGSWPNERGMWQIDIFFRKYTFLRAYIMSDTKVPV